MNASPLIVLDGVSKQFAGIPALHSVSTTIEAGRLTGLVGPDGAGKTTLIRMITGLMAPSSGTITVCGLNSVQHAESLADRIGYMPQRFGLYEDLSVQENLRLYANLRGIAVDDQPALFGQLLEFTRLAPFTERLAGRLSGGMKQKLGLACALMAKPEVLLLDEPGVGVDPVSRQDLWRMVLELTDGGMAVLWATAYLDEAERCASVLLLNEGRLVFDGAPASLTASLEQRSFHLLGRGDRRRLLSAALAQDAVCDGVIQGDAVRLVLQNGARYDSLDAFAMEHGAALRAVPPRFEDAFIDLLGGGPGGTSSLAERMPVVHAAADPVVHCRDLCKNFGDFVAADRVDFQVRPGEIFGLLGPNGAGKSTTFKMLCGLLRPSSGDASIGGYDLRHATRHAKMQLGYMAQKFSLYGLLSVQQNLEFSAGVYGLDGVLRRQRVAEMVETFHLQRFLHNAPEQLPLGFRQRLALACALMHRPSVLFLDEPTSGVDPITRREFWTHINGLVAKGVTVLVTTHFMDEAEYCDRVAMMYRARVIALDTPDRLKARAVSAATPEPTMEQGFIHLIQAFDQS